MWYFSAHILFLIFLCRKIASQNPVVTTKYGPVEGLSVPIHTGQVVDAFMSVPYAKPPVNDLRFMRPEEPAPWDETLLAHEPQNACVQKVLTGVHVTHWGWEKFDEDCLTLNIYKPQTGDTELLPVLVFIHGGDFINGAGFIYPGYIQASFGVVVVTVNYRLSILGFATTEDEVVPGNMGLFDQALAFRFIQENIAEFGGDPSRVTISGESAGAASVGFHQVSPVSTGLYQQAILQSGTELDYWAIQFPEEQPSDYLRQVAESVNCTTESSQAMVDCLRTVPAQTLVSASFECTDGFNCGTFRPTIDGTFITDYPSALRERGEYNKLPEMIGVCQDEGSIWLAELPLYGVEPGDGVNRTVFDEVITHELTMIAPSWPDPDRLNDAIQAVRFQYGDYPYFYDPIKNRQMYINMYSDLYFGHSADAQAKSHALDVPVYFYVYDYVEENDIVPDVFGTHHGAELTFTFGWPYMYLEENQAAWNHSLTNKPNGTEPDFTDNDIAVSDFMMTLWTNFAKYGNPTPEPVGPDGGSTITWTEFISGNLTYAYLSDNPEMRINFRQQDYAFWEYYLLYITQAEPFYIQETQGRNRRMLPLEFLYEY